VRNVHIPEFWCGVIVTVVFEVGAFIGYGIYLNHKKKGGYDETAQEANQRTKGCGIGTWVKP
jgi:hypothetical protein